MYTNIKKHGGNFRDILDKEFSKATKATIASGYTSLDIIKEYENHFIKIAKKGGTSRLLLGMAFYEGLGEKKLNTINLLNQHLLEFKNESGVYVSNGRRYHGKVYHFEGHSYSNVYVGSSNFSSSGIKGNIECTIPVFQNEQKNEILNFLDDLYSTKYAVRINKAQIIIPKKKKIILKTVNDYWHSLKKHNPKKINTSALQSFELDLNRIVEKEKSNLNVFFGKGRLNNKTGKIIPRPWYEIEIIATNKLTSHILFPKGDFLAYTDDGFIIPMRTQGDYFKNIRSKKSLQLFGIWLKGKLEKQGVLKRYEPVTKETLEEYGNDKLTFYKLKKGVYFISF